MENAYIETYSGNYFYPKSPNVGDIQIEDIAHSLSQICRFGGHTKHFYSVGQHSIIQLYGLLHDATEGYLIDLPSPIKKMLPEYKRMEDELHEVIWKALQIKPPTEKEWKYVKFADEMMLYHEANQLLKNASWSVPFYKLQTIKIKEEKHDKVKKKFLKLFQKLKKEH